MKTINGRQVYSVTEINNLTRNTLEQMSFWIEAEISSFKGHNPRYRWVYFDLKDPQTEYKISCILEPDIFQSLDFALEDGMTVLALGHLTLWEKEARLQMYLIRMEIFGEGQLLAKLEALKKKLQEKGYFKEEAKKGVPSYPTNIAVISSKTSDAWQDFKKHSIDKFPVIKTSFFDVKVQGESSAPQIVKSIKEADSQNFEAIVLIRGGGSLEDLSSFNDERVADAIFAAKTPIVVGVGHEKDVTIAQLVADIAASTPTDAAKVITHDFLNLEERLSNIRQRMEMAILQSLNNKAQALDNISQALEYQKETFKKIPKNLQYLKQALIHSQERVISQNEEKIQHFMSSLKNSWKLSYQQKEFSLKRTYEKLGILSPEKTLKRGYSIVTKQNGKIVKSVEAIDIGERLRLKFAQGKAYTKVIEKK